MCTKLQTLPSRIKNLAGQPFGRWTVIDYAGNGGPTVQKTYWLCRCVCGQEKPVPQRYLLSGESQSCGCLQRDEAKQRAKIHGLTRSPTYISWQAMLVRCYNKKHPHFDNYGGRGIKVTKRWLIFENFLRDMGLRPDGCTLDRKENTKNYNKTNCRWASRRQQNRNTRRAVYVTIAGKTKHLAAWAEEYGLDYEMLRRRVKRGWPDDKLLSPARNVVLLSAEDRTLRQRVRNKLNQAIGSGRIIRPVNCEECGRSVRLQGHHYLGYAVEQALVVRWLCTGCHALEVC